MRGLRRCLAAAAAVLSVSAITAGCGIAQLASPTAARPGIATSLAVVTGDANSPAFQTTPEVGSLLAAAFEHRAPIAVIDAGGRPRVLAATLLGGDYGNSVARAAGRSAQLAAVTADLVRVAPSAAESDPWAAFTTAVDWVAGHGGGTVVVANAGLGTKGLLNYTQPGLLDAEPSQVVAFARTHHELPDAHGVRVVLAGIGWTSPPQAPLDQATRANLTTQWQALAVAAGATVTVDPTPQTDPAPHHAPPVTVIHPTAIAWQASAGTCGVALDNVHLRFVVGTANYANPAAARTTLRSIVKDLTTNHQPATVTGTTSSEGGYQLNERLSRSRATMTARTMESLGLPATQIAKTVGAGDQFPGYIPDTAPDGTLLPGPAAADRQVIITWPCTPSETSGITAGP